MKVVDPYRFGSAVYGGLSWEFFGLNDYIEIDDDPTLDFITAFSVSMWVYRNALATQESLLSKYKTTGNQRAWAIEVDTSEKLQVSFGDPANGTFEAVAKSNSAITLGTWIHLGITYNAGTLVMYQNGSSFAHTVTSGAIPASLWNSSRPLLIGAGEVSSVVKYFTGMIADVYLFDVALTSGNMTTIYNGGTPTDLTLGALSGDIVSYWNATDTSDGAAGVLDVGGVNTNHGTLTNMSVAANVVANYPP